MTENLPVSINVKRSGLDSYLATVKEQPILTAEKEHEFAIRFQDEDDLDAARQLILSHLRFVVSVARGFTGYGIPLSDLIQEGNVGLMKAVKRYEPDRNIRLVSFAVHWIKAEIYDFILRNWKIVRIATTKAHRKLFFNLRKHRESLESMSESEITKLSEDLQVPKKTVREMEIRMNGGGVSFDSQADESNDNEMDFAPSAYLGDMTFDPEQVYEKNFNESHHHEQLTNALSELDERSRDIIQQRWLDEGKSTLHALADKYKVSAERIRQIEQKAMATMRLSILESN